MSPTEDPNSFMPLGGPNALTSFDDYKKESVAHGTRNVEPERSILGLAPLSQSFSEAHSFSSNYWEPANLPYIGPEYGGDDYEESGMLVPSHLTDGASTDEQTPIHTPEGVTPAASVAGDKQGSMPYATLIYKALMEAPEHTMILQDIYNWFRENTDKVDPTSASKGWQNSIRHNLSMNEVDAEPATDGKRSFAWALDPAIIGKGYVESTTRYRKSQAQRRAPRGQGRQPSNIAPTSIPIRPVPKRNARKQSFRAGTPPNAPRSIMNPVPLAPRPPINPTPAMTNAAHAEYPGLGMEPASQLPTMEAKDEPSQFASYEQIYSTMVPMLGQSLPGYPLPGPLYRGQQSFQPAAAPMVFDAAFGMTQLPPYAMAYAPITPESLWAPPFPPLPKDMEHGADVAVVEYGESRFVPSRPSSLEQMLLNHVECEPGNHSIDCWPEICRY